MEKSPTFSSFQEGAVGVHVLTTDRFKSETLVFRWILPPEENVPENAHTLNFLSSVLNDCNADYPTASALTQKYDETYMMNPRMDVERLVHEGDMMSLSLSFLSREVLPYDEDMLGTAFDLASATLYRPLMTNGLLDEEVFNKILKRVKEGAVRRLDTPHGRSNRERGLLLHRDNPVMTALWDERSYDGVRLEDVSALYHRLRKTCSVAVYYVGRRPSEEVLANVREKICPYVSPEGTAYRMGNYIFTERPFVSKRVEDKGNQSRMMRVYRAGQLSRREKRVLTLFNTILGGDSSSRLFRVVREERSLCYNVHSTCDVRFGTVELNCYYDRKNEGAVSSGFDDVMASMDTLTDEEIAIAKSNYLDTLHAVSDSSSGLYDYWSERLMTGELETVEDFIAMIEGVTREEIVAIGQRLVPDSELIFDGIGKEEA